MKPILSQKWIDAIFNKLSGLYGAQFNAKFSKIVDGVDVGLEHAKPIWAEELGNFGDKPEAIKFAFDNLPKDHAPNAVEFRNICLAAPVFKHVAALTHQHITADPKKVDEFAQAAKNAIGGGKDHMAWAKRPSSQGALDLAVSGMPKDERLRIIIRKLVNDGICTPEFRLLKAYRDGEWVKA